MSDPLVARFKKLTCPLSPGSRIVAYARDSGGEEQDRSVDQQLETYRAYCEHFNLTLVEAFNDRARSGSSTVGRDGFDQMITFLRDRAPEPETKKRKQRAVSNTRPNDQAIHGILIWKGNRFGRNLNDSQFYKADMRRRGYVIISIADNVPDAGDLTPVFETLLDWKAQRDLYDISSDAKRGLAALVTSKKSDGSYEAFAPGIAPKCFTRERVQIGVKRNGEPRMVSRWIPDKKLWLRGQQAWQMRAAGESLAAVHKATRLFKGINSYTTFFRNKIYLGVFEFGELVLENFVTALCTQEQWDKVQAMSKPRPERGGHWQMRHPNQRSDNPFILSGLLKCAHCGSPMIGSTGSRSRGRAAWRYYICTCKERDTSACPSSRLSAASVEFTVVETLSNHILTLEMARAFFRQWIMQLVAEQANSAGHVESLKEQYADVKRAIANLLQLVETGRAGPSAAERLGEREREKANLESLIWRALQRPDPNKIKLPADDVLETFLCKLRERLHSKDPQQVKTVLNGFIVEIKAEKKGGTLSYIFPLPQLVGRQA